MHRQPTVTRYCAIDVVGLRQGAGRYGGNAEVVGVEVKASGSRFLNSAGGLSAIPSWPIRLGQPRTDYATVLDVNANGDRLYPKVE